MSSKALKQICAYVTGADLSSEMISVAKEVCHGLQGYDFIVSRAEEIPARKEKYDIVTAAGVIPWVEQEKFLENLNRLVQKQTYVLIYDFWVSDQMKGSEAYSIWWHDAYLKAFPKSFRREHIWTAQEVALYGFSMIDQVQYNMEYEFDCDSFINFMMIQSNVNVKIEGEGRSAKEIRKWFEQSLKAVFNQEKKKVIFKGYSWYMKSR